MCIRSAPDMRAPDAIEERHRVLFVFQTTLNI